MKKVFLFVLAGFFCLTVSYAQEPEGGQPPPDAIGSGVSLELNQTMFTRGQAVVVTISNKSGESIAYRSGCAMEICRYYLNNKDWSCEDKDCYGTELSMDSGEAVEMKPYVSRRGADSCKFQFKYQGRVDKIERVAYSAEFTID